MKKFVVIIGTLFFMLSLAVIENRAATFIVNNNNNSGAGTLRQAVLDANTSGNLSDTIVFAASVRGKIVLTGLEIELNKPIGTNLTIIGPGADVLSIESNFAHRIFRAQLGNIKISGLRVSRGLPILNQFINLGGGFWVVDGANLTLESCSITENQRGGIYTDSRSTLTINNSLISGNDGGGIDGAGGLSVSNSTVSDNFGADNAGIRWLNGTVTLTNITVSGNRGIDSGGININGATTTILNSTIAENFGGNGIAAHTGGLRIESGTVNLKNTIIADNQAFTPDINGTIVSQGNNLVRNRTGGTGFIASDLPNNTNPRLGGFANNGGATYTYSLRSTSPAINAGNNTGAPAADQRGVARPNGTAVDIGAYESGVRPVTFGKIAFVSDRNGNREIYSINSDGTNTMRLTTNSANDEFPDWSPDGSKIAFSTNRDGNFEIYTMNADGTMPNRLTMNSQSDSEPAFSPDGMKIAFVRNGAGIFLMDANGTGQTAIPNTTDGASPSWSPDGTQIVYTCVNMGSAICKINADGTNRTPFVFNDAIHTSPAWSPDGNSIAFSIDFNVSSFFYFYNPHNVNVIRPMINPGTGNEVIGFALAFSPDGAKIADGTGNLFLRDADGGNPVLLINSTVSGNGNSFLPDWFGQNTPTGSNVAAVSGTTTITFSGVSTGGTTTALPIDPASAGTVPSGYSLGTGFPAYEISTTATYTAPIVVCIKVADTTPIATFNALRILHYVNGTPTDATILSPDTPAPDFISKTICARVNSLSPFVVAQNLAPTAANASISGRVSDAFGNGISRARVSITNSNGETFSTTTSSFGFYRFAEIPVGETYIISAFHKHYQFNSQVITVVDDIQNADFTANQERAEK